MDIVIIQIMLAVSLGPKVITLSGFNSFKFNFTWLLVSARDPKRRLKTVSMRITTSIPNLGISSSFVFRV